MVDPLAQAQARQLAGARAQIQRLTQELGKYATVAAYLSRAMATGKKVPQAGEFMAIPKGEFEAFGRSWWWA